MGKEFTPFHDSSDGWNEETLEDLGVLDSLREASRLLYDLSNCRREETVYSMAERMREIGQDIMDVSENVFDALD